VGIRVRCNKAGTESTREQASVDEETKIVEQGHNFLYMRESYQLARERFCWWWVVYSAEKSLA
jgi:hypothetical protein